MSDRKWPSIVMFIVLVFIALLGLGRVMQSPQFASYRTVHVVQLVGFGACVGAALTGLMVRLLRPRT